MVSGFWSGVQAHRGRCHVEKGKKEETKPVVPGPGKPRRKTSDAKRTKEVRYGKTEY